MVPPVEKSHPVALLLWPNVFTRVAPRASRHATRPMRRIKFTLVFSWEKERGFETIYYILLFVPV